MSWGLQLPLWHRSAEGSSRCGDSTGSKQSCRCPTPAANIHKHNSQFRTKKITSLITFSNRHLRSFRWIHKINYEYTQQIANCTYNGRDQVDWCRCKYKSSPTLHNHNAHREQTRSSESQDQFGFKWTLQYNPCHNIITIPNQFHFIMKAFSYRVKKLSTLSRGDKSTLSPISCAERILTQ